MNGFLDKWDGRPAGVLDQDPSADSAQPRGGVGLPRGGWRKAPLKLPPERASAPVPLLLWHGSANSAGAISSASGLM